MKKFTDEERYKWLRAANRIFATDARGKVYFGPELDAEIDAALAAQEVSLPVVCHWPACDETGYCSLSCDGSEPQKETPK